MLSNWWWRGSAWKRVSPRVIFRSSLEDQSRRRHPPRRVVPSSSSSYHFERLWRSYFLFLLRNRWIFSFFALDSAWKALRERKKLETKKRNDNRSPMRIAERKAPRFCCVEKRSRYASAAPREAFPWLWPWSPWSWTMMAVVEGDLDMLDLDRQASASDLVVVIAAVIVETIEAVARPWDSVVVAHHHHPP